MSTSGKQYFLYCKRMEHLGHGAKNKFMDLGVKMRPPVLCTQCTLKQSH